MKIGYPNINLGIDRHAGKLFTVLSRKRDRILEEARRNVEELEAILKFNVEHNILFFRIRYDLIPFAADEGSGIDWRTEFGSDLARIGRFIRANGIRINIHPDIIIMLNHPDQKFLDKSVGDLKYQAEILDLMGLDQTAKIQVHAGERFNKDKEGSIRRFVERFALLDDRVKRRLVIENENVLCTFRDCMDIHLHTGLPVVPDVLHHEITGRGTEEIGRVLELAMETWQVCDGLMMVDYSSQDPGRMTGKHSPGINMDHFRKFIEASGVMDFDIMLELKDRESSALKAVDVLKDDPRFKEGLIHKPIPAECVY